MKVKISQKQGAANFHALSQLTACIATILSDQPSKSNLASQLASRACQLCPKARSIKLMFYVGSVLLLLPYFHVSWSATLSVCLSVCKSKSVCLSIGTHSYVCVCSHNDFLGAAEKIEIILGWCLISGKTILAQSEGEQNYHTFTSCFQREIKLLRSCTII